MLYWYEQVEERYNPYTKQVEKISVSPDNLIASINISKEDVAIKWSKIELDWDVNVLWTFSISSTNMWHIDTNDLDEYNITDDGVYIDSNWIRWYYWWEQTLDINSTNGNAYFKWTILAQEWFINWWLEMWASGWIQSEDYNSVNGWKIDNTWIEIGVDKSIDVHPGWSIWVWTYWAWPKVIIHDWYTDYYYSSTSTPWRISALYDWTLLTSGNLEPNSLNSQDLWSSSYYWRDVYSKEYNFWDSWAKILNWVNGSTNFPVYYDWASNFALLAWSSVSSSIWTVNRKILVNIWWVDYWLHAELA